MYKLKLEILDEYIINVYIFKGGKLSVHTQLSVIFREVPFSECTLKCSFFIALLHSSTITECTFFVALKGKLLDIA